MTPGTKRKGLKPQLYNEAGKPLCGANKKDGTQCQLGAGYGTGHSGVGSCKFHGGNTRVGIRTAAARSLSMLTGYEIEISPTEALLMCVRIAAAEVTFFTKKILELTNEDELIGQPVKDAIANTKDHWDIVELKMPIELNIWFKAREKSVDNLARYSAMALKAGIEERLVSLAEGMGERLATAIEGILGALELTPAQQKLVPAAVRTHLSQMEIAA